MLWSIFSNDIKDKARSRFTNQIKRKNLPVTAINVKLVLNIKILAKILKKLIKKMMHQLWSGHHRRPTTLTARVCRRCKDVLKIYIIQSAIEQQIRILNYFYTPMKIQFRLQPLPKLWLCVASEYPLLSQKAVKMLLLFVATIYLCETAFSDLTNMINKNRSGLVQSELRVYLSKKNLSKLTIYAKQGNHIPLTK